MFVYDGFGACASKRWPNVNSISCLFPVTSLIRPPSLFLLLLTNISLLETGGNYNVSPSFRLSVSHSVLTWFSRLYSVLVWGIDFFSLVVCSLPVVNEKYTLPSSMSRKKLSTLLRYSARNVA